MPANVVRSKRMELQEIADAFFEAELAFSSAARPKDGIFKGQTARVRRAPGATRDPRGITKCHCGKRGGPWGPQVGGPPTPPPPTRPASPLDPTHPFSATKVRMQYTLGGYTGTMEVSNRQT